MKKAKIIFMITILISSFSCKKEVSNITQNNVLLSKKVISTDFNKSQNYEVGGTIGCAIRLIDGLHKGEREANNAYDACMDIALDGISTIPFNNTGSKPMAPAPPCQVCEEKEIFLMDLYWEALGAVPWKGEVEGIQLDIAKAQLEIYNHVIEQLFKNANGQIVVPTDRDEQDQIMANSNINLPTGLDSYVHLAYGKYFYLPAKWQSLFPIREERALFYNNEYALKFWGE